MMINIYQPLQSLLSKFEDIPGIQTNRYPMRQIKQWDRYAEGYVS